MIDSTGGFNLKEDFQHVKYVSGIYYLCLSFMFSEVILSHNLVKYSTTS